MTQHYVLGTLTAGSRLKTDQGELLLTTIAPQEGRPPESAALTVAEADQGKKALVRGLRQGNILYSAEIVEIVSPVTGAMLDRLLKSGSLTAAELESELAAALAPAPEEAPAKLCALVIGHKKTSPGAANEAAGLSEFDFNDDLARRIEKKVARMAVQRVYRRTYRELPDDINALAPDVVVSLHCNAFNREASGTETLYYEKSAKGREVAAIVQQQLLAQLGLADRGIKGKSSEDRGGFLLRYTAAPCIIAEPFFIDNDEDLAAAQRDLDGLALAYARAIDALPTVL